MRPLYIFDLDGTLALIEHRRHFVSNGNHQWTEFYAACVDDEPNHPVLGTMVRLLASGCDCIIYSGRSDEVYGQTAAWLREHLGIDFVPEIQMRPAGDYTPDDVLKKKWLDTMFPEDRARLVAVFEDRNRMVQMWRDNGVPCFQVAPGDF